MTHETRTGEVGNVKPNGTLDVLAVAYGVVDAYGSVWMPGVFERSAGERLPVIAWAHSRDDPIGRATGYRDSEEGPYFSARLDIGGAVPRADQAFQQMSPGPNGEPPTLSDVSVGFSVPEGGRRSPTEDELRRWPGAREIITEAILDEISVVLRGAVPGASILAGSVRSKRTGEMVDMDAVVAIAKKKSAGEITEAEADEALRLLSAPAIGAPPDPDPEGEQTDTAEVELAAALADADAALDLTTDRSR